jgi:alpha-amylase/alpha-mannosidase (GH57 family)
MDRDLVVHGHFYQPPRENPWTGEVDREPGAEPYHDWNERIFHECYRANAHARIIDDHGRVERIISNYLHMSFNFGPTLLAWMEKHHAITYGRILGADRASADLRGGHGNAIAQAYNHTILPLASRRDKVTQVRWGVADFLHRFGRRPEGMWLPECAADEETLEVLIEQQIKFTVLSPFQAAKTRRIGEKEWRDSSGGQVDASVPYRFFHGDGSGRWVDIIFYDTGASKGVAFEGVLTSSAGYVDRIERAPLGAGRLVAVATDGESYGHHTRFGERCLAHAMESVVKTRGFRTTNFAEFLATHEVRNEVKIDLGPDKRGSSWSCAHGVGRWFRDCGCHTGGRDGWNQQWRKPLREALDNLHVVADEIYQEVGGQYFEDPWEARNDYVGVLLERHRTLDDFLGRHAKGPLAEFARVRAMSLVEMQLQAQLMYTSCGWFFSDVSGIETRQILKYAGRVLDLLGELGRDETGRFLEQLSEAKSNKPEEGNGADVFRRHVEPVRVTPHRISAHLAITGLLDDDEESGEVAGYSYHRQDFTRRSLGRLSMCTSRVELQSMRTRRRHHHAVAALHLGGIDFYAVVKEQPIDDGQPKRGTSVSRGGPGGATFAASAQRLWNAFSSASLPALLRRAAIEFGPHEFGLEHLLPDSRERISEQIFASLLRRFSEEYAFLYEDNRRTLDMLQSAGFPLPRELRAAAEFTLGRLFEEEIKKQEQSRDPEKYRRAMEIAEQVGQHGYQIDRTTSRKLFENMITDAVRTAVSKRDDESYDSAIDLLALTDRLDLEVNLEPAQEAAYDAALSSQGSGEKFAKLLIALWVSPHPR